MPKATIPAIPNQGARPGPHTPVTVVLDRPRTLRLSWAAMREIREQTRTDARPGGINMLEAVDAAEIDMLDDFPVLLAEMLRHEDADITAAFVAEHLDPGNLPDVLRAFFRIQGRDLPSGLAEPADAEASAEPRPLAPKTARTRS
jgi:hypothetical protein